MRNRPALRRSVLATIAVGGIALAVAGSAWAHAAVSPAVAKSNALQQYTLSVPTEKEGATTKVEFTVPNGFAIDSFEAEPGWKRAVQATGSGEEAVIHKVTWTGGSVPTDEDAVFRFNASASSSKTYTFAVRQTYSDGSVVDWSGPESSDTPAPTTEGVSSFGGSSSTLALVALVVAGLGLLVGIVGVASGRRPLA